MNLKEILKLSPILDMQEVGDVLQAKVFQTKEDILAEINQQRIANGIKPWKETLIQNLRAFPRKNLDERLRALEILSIVESRVFDGEYGKIEAFRKTALTHLKDK